jgi:hypothetical protein
MCQKNVLGKWRFVLYVNQYIVKLHDIITVEIFHATHTQKRHTKQPELLNERT